MVMLSKEFGFTPNEIWAIPFGEFLGYADYIDKLIEHTKRQSNRSSSRSRRRGR